MLVFDVSTSLKAYQIGFVWIFSPKKHSND